MKAKELERYMVKVSQIESSEMTDRFQRQRDAGALPRERGVHARDLDLNQIVSALLGLVAIKPSFAGLIAKGMADLVPVGGSKASYKNANTLQEVLIRLLSDYGSEVEALSFRLTEGKTTATNANGYAEICYSTKGESKRIYFVHRTALSLLSQGKEEIFQPRDYAPEVAKWMEFSPSFFHSLLKRLPSIR